MIGADAQDLDACGLELRQRRLEAGQFLCSGAGQERDGEGAQDESSSHDTLGGHGSSLYGVA